MSQTLRLLFPQWQGGNVAALLPDLPLNDARQGYVLGAQLLQWLAPPSANTATVPVSLDLDEIQPENGIFAYQPLVRQLAAAFDVLNVHQPQKIVMLGGECSVSVAPFSYLAQQYGDDLAVLWLDAHPDLRTPFEDYDGYHAMALAVLLGFGDEKIVNQLPATIKPENVLIAGFRSTEDSDLPRPEKFGVKTISAEPVNNGGEEVLNWLKNRGVKKVAVHLDLDGLDPQDLFMGVVGIPNGLKVAPTVKLLQEIAAQYDLVGLTVAEPMPKEVIKLRNLLSELPLISE